MNLRTQKELAAKILKVGISRVRVENDPDVAEAITREDVRELIRAGPKKGPCSAPAKKRAEQKKKGRMKSRGSKKGTKNARKKDHDKWIERIRAIRRFLKELKEAGQIDNAAYRKLYRYASGGTFRSKKHVLMYIKDHELLKGEKPKKKSKKEEKAKEESAAPKEKSKKTDAKSKVKMDA